MRTSLILSVVLHIALLSAMLLNFTSSTRIETNSQPVTVELISPSEITQIKAGKKNAEEKDAARSASAPEKKSEPVPPPKAPEPKPVDKIAEKQAVTPPPPPKAAEPPKPAEPEHKPEPKVAAKPEPVEPPKREEPPKVVAKEALKEAPKETPKPEKPKPEKQAEAKPKKTEPKPERDTTPFRDRVADVLKHPAEEKPQPAPPVQTKREFDPDRIQALLNRDPKAGAPAAAQEAPKELGRKPSSFQDQAMGVDQPTAPPRETQGAPSGHDARMSVNEIDAFVAQISRCWTPPVGGLGGEAIVVKLRIELKQDGSLVKPPQIANAGSSPFFTAAADSAMRAVFQCQPYTMPQEKFSQWRDMLLNFDPRRMYGG